MDNKRIGAGHASAMARLGLKELRNAFNPSRESVADTEIGLYGSLTQGEIAEAREGPGGGPNQESHADKLSLADLRDTGQQKSRDMENGKEPGQRRDKGDDLER